MSEQECRCPGCNKLLGKVILIDGTKVIVSTWCKNCKQLVNALVERKEAA